MDVLIKPIITEKSLSLASLGCYTFQVHIEANKHEIAQAVEAQFKVDVTGVTTVKLPGKSKRTGKKRTLVPAMPWKKALVKLGKDQKISLFEITESKK